MFTDADSIIAYDPVEHGIFINKNELKDQADLDGYNSKASEAWNYIMQNIDNLTGRQRELATVYKDAGRSLVGNGSVHDYVAHEMGHHAEWTMLDASEHNAIGKSMSTYAPRISRYANVSVSEYIAESFSACVDGEISIIDPSFVSIMERKGMIPGSSTATSATVEYGRLGISSLPEIWLPTEEYAEVMSEIRTRLSDKLKDVPVVSKQIGNYVYTFENDWENGDFSIIGKSPIDKEWRRRRR